MHWIFDDIHCDAIAHTSPKKDEEKKEENTTLCFDQTKGFQRNINFRIQFEISVYERMKIHARAKLTQHETILGKIDCRLQRMKR